MTPFVCFSGIAPTVGDTAIGQSILQLLTRRLDLPVRVHSPRPDAFGALPEIAAADLRRKLPAVPAPVLRSMAAPIQIRRLLADLRRTGGARMLPQPAYAALRDALRGCAAVVVQGGPGWTDRQLTGQQVLARGLLLEAARHYGARVYQVGVSCGPFAWPYPRRAWMAALCRWTLDRHDLLLVRDRYSRPALRRLGVRAPVVESIDPAVFLDARLDARFAAIGARIAAGSRRRVVVAVRDFQPFYQDARAVCDAALRRLAAVLDHVQREWADVFFLSTDHTPQALKRTDVEVAYEVQRAMTVDGSTVVETEVANPAALKQIYGRFDAMISMRLHPAILGLGSGVPCLLLSYDRKCDDFLSRLDLGDDAIPIDAFAPTPAIARLGAMLADEGLRERIRARYAALRVGHAGDYDSMIAQIAARGRQIAGGVQ